MARGTSGKRRPRVLFLTASYPTPETPATGIFVREHALAVSPHCDVAVVHLDRADGVKGLYEVEEARGEELPTWRIRYPRRPAPLSYAGNAAAALAGLRLVRGRGLDPDLIHAHFFLAGLPAVLLGRLHRKPVVITEHWGIFLPSNPDELSRLMHRAARFAFEHAEVVLPVSEDLEQALAAQGVRARFRVVPNAVDERLFHPAAGPSRTSGDPWRLLTVGVMYEAKGYDLLLEAAARLRAEGCAFRLDVVGDGPLLREYQDLAGQLGLDGTVAFHGYAAKPEIAGLMRQADLFVLASRFDNSPCALIEALASGLPVVATAVGGVPELVAESDGLLADPSAESIAGQIAVALDRLDRFDRDGISRRAHARFGAEPIGRELAEIYAECLHRRGAGRRGRTVPARRLNRSRSLGDAG